MKTISEVEATVQAGLEALRNVPLSPEITLALKFLLPEGLSPVVQFEEDGRKKRSSAAASNWNPRTGEIRIYFDPISAVGDQKADLNPLPSSSGLSTTQDVHVSVQPLKPQGRPSAHKRSLSAARHWLLLKNLIDSSSLSSGSATISSLRSTCHGPLQSNVDNGYSPRQSTWGKSTRRKFPIPEHLSFPQQPSVSIAPCQPQGYRPASSRSQSVGKLHRQRCCATGGASDSFVF
jgi:hypothetical protein